jgi:hypothetical protein
MTKIKRDATPFERQVIGPHEQWFDPIGIRFIVNLTDRPLKVQFSHNIRAVEMIAVSEAEKGNSQSEEIQLLEGEIIEEEDYEM